VARKRAGARVRDREAPSVVHAGACTANAGARTHGSVGVRIRGCTGARPPASAPTPDSGGAVRLMQAPARWSSEVATAHAMRARTAPHVCTDPPITGKMPKHVGATRWWSANDVQELSLLPNLLNGNLRSWAEAMIGDGICPATAPKMLTFLDNKDKKNRCMIEMITVVNVGKHLKAGGTRLEGDGFEFITAYDTLVAMGDHLKSSMSSFELMSELLQVVVVNGGQDDASLYCGSRRDRVASVSEILLSLSSVKGVMVSINAEWWDWGDEDVPQPRYKGKIVKWQSKSVDSEQLIIEWENGIVDGAMQEGMHACIHAYIYVICMYIVCMYVSMYENW